MISRSWEYEDHQVIFIKNKKYNVHAAINMAEKLKVKTVLLEDFNISYPSPSLNSLRSFCEHVKMVDQADLSYPIILNEDGSIIDGKHRLIKALVAGKKTIKVKRFEHDPESIFEWVE